MKRLWLMELISKATDWKIGIHHGKRSYYYIVSSKTGMKYYSWVGIVISVLMFFSFLVSLFFAIGTAGVLAEYGIHYWWLSAIMAGVTFLTWKAGMFFRNVFEVRPDTYDENYMPTEAELEDEEWDNWVH